MVMRIITCMETFMVKHGNESSNALLVKKGQVDSPELPETTEITEMAEYFTKVTKYLTKFKETLINYVWEKSHVIKQ